MKLTASILLSLIISLIACNKKLSIPDCIEVKISQFKNVACQNGASVKEYKFQGEEVYVFEMGYCGSDFTSDVLDEDCNLQGRLGGIVGNTKINGVEFSSATYIRTLWSD